MDGPTTSHHVRANPFAPPRHQRGLPALHWRERPTEADIAAHRAGLLGHCADPDRLAADQVALLPLPRGLALTLASLTATALVISIGIAALAVVLARDRLLLLLLAAVCASLSFFLALAARSRTVLQRAQAGDDREDPVLTMRSYLEALHAGGPGEIISRLSPVARGGTVEAPPSGRHRGRAAYACDDHRSMLTWSRTFARSDSVQPRWMLVHGVDLESRTEDLAWVRVRVELRWWALWGVIVIGILFIPLHVFALIPGLLLYLTLLERQVVVVTKLLLRGPDGRWYLWRPEIASPE